MKTFEYTIKDARGIHARPAGLPVKEIKKYESAAMTDRVDSTSLQRRGVRQSVPKLYKSYFRSIPRQKPTVDLALEWKDEECPDPFRYNVYLTTPTDSDYWRYQAEALFQNDEKSGDAATLLSSRPTVLLAFS